MDQSVRRSSVRKRQFDAQRLILPSASIGKRWNEDNKNHEEKRPDWIHDLRRVWDEEVQLMNPEKQEWFMDQQKAIFNEDVKLDDPSLIFDDTTYDEDEELNELYHDLPEESKKDSGLFTKLGGFLRRKSESDEAVMKRYARRCEAVKIQQERFIINLNTRRKKLQKKQKTDIEKWKSWGVDSLVNVGRTYYETKLLWLNTRLEIEVYKVGNLKSLIEATNQWLEGEEDTKEHLEFDDQGMPIDPSHLKLPDKYQVLVDSCKQMEMLLDDLQSRFREIQKAEAKPQKKEERTNKVNFLLLSAAGDSLECPDFGMYFHSFQPAVQNEFNRLMVDERLAEGQWLRDWLELLRNSEADVVTSKAIIVFIKNFVKYIMKNHEIGQTNLLDELEDITVDETVMTTQPLKLYVERMIHPRITPILFAFDKENIEATLNKWNRKIQWMRMLSQDEIGIEKGLQLRKDETSRKANSGTFATLSRDASGTLVQDSLTGLPYERGIRVLTKMDANCSMVPTDIVYYSVCTIQEITDEAQEYNSDPDFLINADVLFPIITWVVIHAKVFRLAEIINHSIRFLGDQRFYGFGGFCLCQIEAAVAHIFDMRPENFGFPADFEESLDLGRHRDGVLRDVPSAENSIGRLPLSNDITGMELMHNQVAKEDVINSIV